MSFQPIALYFTFYDQKNTCSVIEAIANRLKKLKTIVNKPLLMPKFPAA